jgi:hypothetical protein
MYRERESERERERHTHTERERERSIEQRALQGNPELEASFSQVLCM